MVRFVSLLRRFRSDESGVFAIIFALIAIVLVAFGGAVVDYVSVQQARTRTQVALDSAALALQPQIFVAGMTNETLRVKAESLLLERLKTEGTWNKCPAVASQPCAKVDSATMNTTDGSLNLVASLIQPTNFVSLVGITALPATIVSEATRKKLNLEVAFVLDNSNSMSTNSRMTNLIAATKCAANILFNDDCNSTATTTSVLNTKLAIVPFTMLVNVGTNNANAAWMDRKGYNTLTSTQYTEINNDNFDNDDDESTEYLAEFDRIGLFSKLTNVAWGGCVEARKNPYDTDDTLPSLAVKNTLFTPLFAPDEPDSGFSNSYISDTPASCKQTGTCQWTETKTKCTSYTNCQSGSVTTNTEVWTSGVNRPASCTCSGQTIATDSGTSTSTGSGNNKTFTRVRTCSISYDPVGLSNRELQQRLCKYTGATASGISQASAHGPNSDCPVNAIQPLTATKATITTAINKLAPQGGTNIHAGTEWGFRVLSPTEPFTEGGAYDSATSKVMIIMTDGENTAYQTGNMNNTTYYSSYGFPWNNRMGTATSTNAQLVTEMNKRTTDTCTNAKKAGITIYTVGLAVDQSNDPATNTKMLKDCSSGTGYSFFPAASSDLTAVFKTIASQLSSLRLAK